MDEWHVGDPEDWGDSVGVPDIPYMGYLNDDDDEDPKRPPEDSATRSEADVLGDEAWKLYTDFRDDEALVMIDRALSYNRSHSNNWNRKGIILESLKRFDESKECYDRSLAIRRSRVVVENKARMIKDWCWSLYHEEKDLEMAINLANEAIREISSIKTEENIETYKNLASIMESRRDSVKEWEMQAKELECIAKERLITIAGTQHYSVPKLGKVMHLELRKEPENAYDRDAIAVYLKEEKIGYVANSDFTSCDLTSRASDLKDLPDFALAQYLMNYRGQYHIARII